MKILDRFLTVICALLFLQIPLFMGTYQLQLIGHVKELEWQVQDMEKSALLSGKNLVQYIKKFTTNTDPDFTSEGKRMEKVSARSEKLTRALHKLKEASPLLKPFIFLTYLEWDIFKASLKSFTPGIAFNGEGAIYGLLGMLFGALIFNFLKKIKTAIY